MTKPNFRLWNRFSAVALLFVFGFFLALSGVFSYTRAGVRVSAPMRAPEAASAATSSNLNMQARLYNANGSVVPDGYYNIEFKLYDQSSGGSALWTEAWYDSNGVTAGNDNRVRVVNGYMSVPLGTHTAFGAINWDQDLWISLNVGGSTQTATPTYDGEMSPRIKLTAVPYAFQARQAEKLLHDQGTYSGQLDFDTLTDNRNILLPDEDGTICLQGSTNCGFVETGDFSLQGAYDGGNTILTTDGNDIDITLADTATDANFTIDIATGSTGEFKIQSNGTDVLQIGAAGQLQLDVQGSSGGILIGGDANLYRSAADVLRTSDALTVDGLLTGSAGITITGGAANINASGTSATSIGNAAGTLTLTGSSSSTVVLNGSTLTATELLRLDGKDADLVDTNDAVATAITGTGALNAGSITSGFGAIDTGTDNITTTGTISGGNITVSGSQFTNNGSTLNTAQSLGDFPAGGAIGTAASTVDVDTSFAIAQTTAGQTLSLPNPTTPTAGRLVFVLNTGSASFTMHGVAIPAGYGQIYVWDGSSWILGASGGGSTISLQGAYDGGNTILTADATDIEITLANTATDANFIIDIATSSTGELKVQSNGTDVLQIGAAGQLQLDVQGSSGGILIGGDANLYRSAADTLTTDSNFIIDDSEWLSLWGGSVLLTTGYLQQSSAAAGSDQFLVSTVSGDAVNRFRVNTDGGLAWGDGTNARDTNLYRSAANTLKTDDVFDVGQWLVVNGSGSSAWLNVRSSDGSPAIRTYDASNNRVFNVASDGALSWGSTGDTSLSRSGAGELTTNGDLVVQGGDLLTNQTTFNLLNATATTINFGGGATTAINIGPGSNTATSINIAGGSGNTGCTVDGATGDLTCTGTITGNGESLSLQGAYDLGNTILSTDARDIDITLANTATDANFIIDIATSSTSEFQIESNGTDVLQIGAAGQLQLDVQGSGGGILLGGDVHLYRSAADTLYTDDWIRAQGGIEVRGDAVEFVGGASTDSAFRARTSGDSVARFNVAASGAIEWGAGGASARDTNLYRLSANVLTTDDAFSVNGGNIYLSSSGDLYAIGQISTELGADSGPRAALNQAAGGASKAGLLLGSGTGAADTNLYRDSASVLKTDDDFITAGDITIQGGDLLTNQTTFNLLNATATTINFGGAATTAINIGPGSNTATSINIAGGSGNTGCTVDGVTGNLTCTGTITGNGESLSLQGAYDLGNTILSTDARDIDITLANTATDANFIIDIATSSTSEFQIESNGTDVLQIGAAGQLQLDVQGSAGGILLGGDVHLYRSGANTLFTDDWINARGGIEVRNGQYAFVGGSSTDAAYSTRVSGDSQSRWEVNAAGQILWGPGGGTAPDTNLYRSAANTLWTDDSFGATGTVGSNGYLWAAANADTLLYLNRTGSSSRKAQIHFQDDGTTTWILGQDGGGTGTQDFFLWDNVANASRLVVDANGQLQSPATGSSAGILIGGDAQIYRSAANKLQLGIDDDLDVRNSAGDFVSLVSSVDSSHLQFFNTTAAAEWLISSFVGAETDPRFLVDVQGKQTWGTGTGAGDTNIYRSNANELTTDDSLVVALNLTVNGNTTIGNANADTATINAETVFANTTNVSFTSQTVSTTAATLTLTPTSSYVLLECNRAAGANTVVTMSETGARDGQLLIVTIRGDANNAGTCSWADSAGVQQVRTTGATNFNDFDSLTLIYNNSATNQWVQVAESHNN